MPIPSRYNPKTVEDKWYKYWLENKLFESIPNDKEAYTIVVPPPNVTGVLHMGHVLNNTIQDVLIRRARLKGYNACWVPGTDHASIATEAKIVDLLKKEGKTKADISREEFINLAWEWTHKHGGIILEQLKKLGCSCDWSRNKFTLDKDLYDSVIKVFVDLYHSGYIYKGKKMVNWDPQANTTISDEEVIYKEQEGKLYYIQYQIVDSGKKITVATTRPETIFGDTALCFHPKDKRYKSLKDKKAIVPICNREIPIITDDYIQPDFGTGILKITPAHDIHDFEIGKKNNLEVIDVLNNDGTLNAFGLHYKNQDRFVVRKKIEKELLSLKTLEKTESYHNKVGTSERTAAIIEPKLSVQWFLKTEAMAKPALDVVLKGDIQFFPSKFVNAYKHWMTNIHDWNISRQLYWGHRIPVYYYGNSGEYVVATTPEKALDKIWEITKNEQLGLEDIRQESDVLDTWFSSWLWPMSVFNGILEPNNAEVSYYYPTNDLVSAPEILFFWIARMVMAGIHFNKKVPFKNVYFTGIVRDKKRRKMSKSLGNSPDPLELIKIYGADGVRLGMLMASPAGNDLKFDEDLCKQGQGFCNKLWNAFRLIKHFEVEDKPQTEVNKIAVDWFENILNQELNILEEQFKTYRISEALLLNYKFVWNEFCAWYLEVVKPEFKKSIDRLTYKKTCEFLEHILIVLHPFVPFITEEIWQFLKPQKESTVSSIMLADWPNQNHYDIHIIEKFNITKSIISNIRSIRKTYNLSFKKSIELIVLTKDGQALEHSTVIKKLVHISEISTTKTPLEDYPSFRVARFTCFLNIESQADEHLEMGKIKQELTYLKGFLASVQKKLNNKKFINHAPQKIIDVERKKESDTISKIETLEKQLK